MSSPEASRRGAGALEALSVLRRLVRETRGGLSHAWAALASIVGETVVDTAVIPVLIALTFLAIARSPEALGGSAPVASVDWIQRLGRGVGGSESERLRSLLLFVLLTLAAWFLKWRSLPPGSYLAPSWLSLSPCCSFRLS